MDTIMQNDKATKRIYNAVKKLEEAEAFDPSHTARLVECEDEIVAAVLNYHNLIAIGEPSTKEEEAENLRLNMTHPGRRAFLIKTAKKVAINLEYIYYLDTLLS